ncbi:acyl-CoA dehydrogenase family protein [Nocardioides nitrophenolicus]|uniref:acyl-CoA dehydrogenase family protein n=1 Tax=Nocardioides nitrophenolicus TaxID=60489 RepID=UPI00195ACA69|nr:acyl-CoA dehydrogenase family protein [Nocardioides nitrophenolicus]MBM7517543.1 alkylation response protein AidB-like acyl-CoA dehydrogenase [Nocardioides nitrophenolicus]
MSLTDAELLDKYRPVFDKIRATSIEREENDRLALEEAGWLKEAGYTASRVPTEYGGDGASLRQHFLLTIELAAAESNLPHALRIHFRTTEDHWQSRDEARSQEWLTRIAGGAVVGTAVSERTGEFRKPSTTLTRRDGALLLNGTKYYSSGALYADYLTVSAAEENGDLLSVVVRADAPGVERIDDWAGFGQRASASGTTVFTDAPVDGEDWIFPPVGGSGTRLAHLQLTHLATAAGIVRRAVDDVAEFVRARQRTYPHASAAVASQDPLVQQVIGKADAVAHALRSIVLEAADALDRAQDARFAFRTAAERDRTPEAEAVVVALELEAELAAYRAQSVVFDLAIATASDIFEVGGSSALDRKHHLDRHWRNLRTVASHNPIIYRDRQLGDYVLNGTPPASVSSEDTAGKAS